MGEGLVNMASATQNEQPVDPQIVGSGSISIISTENQEVPTTTQPSLPCSSNQETVEAVSGGLTASGTVLPESISAIDVISNITEITPAQVERVLKLLGIEPRDTSTGIERVLQEIGLVSLLGELPNLLGKKIDLQQFKISEQFKLALNLVAPEAFEFGNYPILITDGQSIYIATHIKMIVSSSGTEEEHETRVAAYGFELIGSSSSYGFSVRDENGEHTVYSDAVLIYGENGYTLYSGNLSGKSLNGRTLSGLGTIIKNGYIDGVFDIRLGSRFETAINTFVDFSEIIDLVNSNADAIQNLSISSVEGLGNALSSITDSLDSINQSMSAMSDAVNAIVEDGIISPKEKLQLRRLWVQIQSDYNRILSVCNLIGVTAEKDAIVQKFNELAEYLNNGETYATGYPLWINDDNKGIPTSINPSVFEEKFNGYFQAAADCLKAIHTRELNLREDLRAYANQINTYTQNVENQLRDTNDFVDKISSDSFVDKKERAALLNKMTELSQWFNIDIQVATVYGVDVQDYTAAYNELVNYLQLNIFDSENDIVPIVRADFDRYFDNLFNQRMLLMDSVNMVINSSIADITDQSDEAYQMAAQAQANASAALSSLNEMVDDNVITPFEKIELKRQYGVLNAEHIKILSQAVTYSVSTQLINEYENYKSAIDAYMDGILSNMQSNSNVNGDDLRNAFYNYFSIRQDVLNAISNIISNGLTQVSERVDDIEDELSEIVNDARLSPGEKKKNILPEWKSIWAEKTNLENVATSLSITTEKTSFTNAFNALAKYLNNGIDWTGTNDPDWIYGANLDIATTINPSEFLGKFSDYYQTRSALVKKINETIILNTDSVQESLNSFEIGGQNLLSNSESPDLVAYSGATLTKSSNYTIYEWGTGKAVKYDTSGGTNILKAYINMLSTAPAAGDLYSWSGYIKNFGNNNIVVYSNLGGLSSTIAPGEAKRIKFEGVVGNGVTLPQLAFRAPSVEKNISFAVWRFKMERGSRCTEWNLTSDEVNQINQNAINAQTAANAAQSSANAANALLADIANDNKLTPSEKMNVRKEWDIIAAEKSPINSQASTFGITTENATYNTKFQALADYLNNGVTWTSGVPTWINDSNLSTTTNIVGSTFRTKFKEYYDARIALLNAISAKAKQLADTAQSTASTANTNALNRGNLLNWNGLRYKDYPIDSASYQDFASSIYGTASENAIVSAIGPFGYETKVWEGKNVDADSPSGGFYTKLIDVDISKKYMFVVWMRYLDDSVSGAVYFGTYPSRVRKVTDGSLDSHSYFASIANKNLVKNRWYLLVGFINPDTYTGSTVSEATGIYDSVTRQRVNFDGAGLRNEFRFETGVTQVYMRAFSNSVSTGVRVQLYGAGVYECNGNEPTIEQLLSGAYVGTVAAKPNDLNLKAYYTFDKSATQDDSLNSKTLTKVGTVGLSNSYIKGKAARFDRTGYLIRDDASLKASEVTISCWIYFNTVSTGVNGIFSLSYHVRAYVSTTDNLTFNVYNGSSWVGILRKLKAQKWYHVVFQLKQGTGGYIKMYINGILVGTEYSDTLQYNTSNNLTIGVDYNDSNTYRLDGYIDDFRLYNYILADNEVLWLYTNPGAGIDYGAVKTVIDGGLVSSGTIMVGQGSSEDDYTVKAGMTGEGHDAGSIRLWAGAKYADRYNAPFRASQDGTMYASKGHIGSWKIDSGKLISDGTDYLELNPVDKCIRINVSGNEKVLLKDGTLLTYDQLKNTSNGTDVITFSVSNSQLNSEDNVYTSTKQPITSIGAGYRYQLTISYQNQNADFIDVIFELVVNVYDSTGATLIFSVSKAVSTRYSTYNYTFNEMLTTFLASGTYKVEFKLIVRDYSFINEVEADFPGYEQIFYYNSPGILSFNTAKLVWTQVRTGVYIQETGLSAYYTNNKAFVVNNSDPNYFLRSYGPQVMRDTETGSGIEIKDNFVKFVRFNMFTNYAAQAFSSGSASIAVHTLKSLNVLLTFTNSSYYAVLPSLSNLRTLLGITSSSDKIAVVLNMIVSMSTTTNSRIYGRGTAFTNSEYPYWKDNNGNAIEYLGAGKGDAFSVLLTWDGTYYYAYLLNSSV